MQNIRKQTKLLLLTGIVTATASLALIGCGGGGGSSESQSPSMLGAITSVIPGLNNPGAQRAVQGVQLGAQMADRLDLNNQRRQDAIGQSVATAITNQYKLVTDPGLNDYVNEVGLTVASTSPRPELNFTFGILDTPEVNAFSAPGGYIFITKGALAMAADESELAGVLAHEIAHVTLDHGINAVKRSKDKDILVRGATMSNPQLQAFGGATDVIADTVMVKGYNRDQETEADAAAVSYLASAGYDPHGLERFLQKLQAKTGTGGGVQTLFKTHPGTADRVAKVQQAIDASGAKGVILEQRFAANVKLK